MCTNPNSLADEIVGKARSESQGQEIFNAAMLDFLATRLAKRTVRRKKREIQKRIRRKSSNCDMRKIAIERNDLKPYSSRFTSVSKAQMDSNLIRNEIDIPSNDALQDKIGSALSKFRTKVLSECESPASRVHTPHDRQSSTELDEIFPVINNSSDNQSRIPNERKTQRLLSRRNPDAIGSCHRSHSTLKGIGVVAMVVLDGQEPCLLLIGDAENALAVAAAGSSSQLLNDGRRVRITDIVSVADHHKANQVWN